MPLITGDLIAVTTVASAVSQVNISVPESRTSGESLLVREQRDEPVTGGSLSVTLAPGPAALGLVVAGEVIDVVPVLVGDAANQTLVGVVRAAQLAEGRTQDELAALVEQVVAAAASVAGAEATISQARDHAVQAVGQAGVDAQADIAADVQRAETAANNAEATVQAVVTDAVDVVRAQVADDADRAEDARDAAQLAAQEAEDAVAAGLADGSVTLPKLGNDVKDQINSKADLIGGKVPTSQIPEVALTKPFSVTSRAALLALDAQEGDIGIITAGADKGSYMLGTGPANVFSSWIQLAVSADAPVTSVNGQTGTVVLNAANVGASPTGHNHTAEQITNLPPFGTASIASRLVQRYTDGHIDVPLTPTKVNYAASKSYVDSRTFTIARQEVTGTNGVTVFEKRGNVVHVASAGTHSGVTIPTDFRPTQVRRVAVPTGATDAGSCTLNTDGSISGSWGAGSAFSYLIQ